MNRAAWVLASVVWTSAAHAAEVSGHDDPAVDVPALQQAVAQGGTVVLTGTFDLGHQTIFVTEDVVIESRGAILRNGGDASAVYGESPNYAALYVGWDGRMLDEPPAEGAYGTLDHPRRDDGVKYFPAYPVDVTIRGVRFEDSGRAAIMVGASRGLVVENNTIAGVASGRWDEWYVPEPTTRWLGIGVSGAFFPPFLGLGEDSWSAESLATAAGSIAGRVEIRDNEISGADDGTIVDDGFLGITADIADATLLIERNHISGFGEGGVGVLLVGPRNVATIAHNTIEDPPNFGILGWSFMFDCSYDIHHNAIRTSAPSADGIGLQGHTSYVGLALDRGRTVDSRVAFNTIELHDSTFGGILLAHNVERTRVQHNTLAGSSAAGIYYTPAADTPARAIDNVIAGNDLSGLSSLVSIALSGPAVRTTVEDNTLGPSAHAAVLLGPQSADNTVVAEMCVVDEGTGNEATQPEYCD